MENNKSFHKKVPLHLRIKEDLKEDILAGKWKPGEAISTEHALASLYEVSRPTVRQAILGLEQEGYLSRQQGKGTFVRQPKMVTKLDSVYSFAQEMSDRGRQAASLIVEFEVILPKKSVQEKLQLTEQELVYKLVRLRMVDGEPTMLETTFLPCRLFSDLSEHKLQQAKSLYRLLEQEYGVVIDHGTDYFEPILVEEHTRHLLGVSKGSPALYLERVGISHTGQIVELSQAVVRGDRCGYYVDLSRKSE